MYILSAFILILFSLITFSSCKDCSPVGQPTLIVDFYRFDSLIASNSKIELDTQYLFVNGEGIDSMLIAQADSSSYSLPLNPTTTQSRFIFNAEDGNLDTLELSYLVETVIEGPDCGVYNEFENIIVQYSTFDSVIVVKSKVEDGDELHLEVYESEIP